MPSGIKIVEGGDDCHELCLCREVMPGQMPQRSRMPSVMTARRSLQAAGERSARPRPGATALLFAH